MHDACWIKGARAQKRKELSHIVITPLGRKTEIAVRDLIEALSRASDHELMASRADAFDQWIELSALDEEEDALALSLTDDEARSGTLKTGALKKLFKGAASERCGLMRRCALFDLVKIAPPLKCVARRAIDGAVFEEIVDLRRAARGVKLDEASLKML